MPRHEIGFLSVHELRNIVSYHYKVTIRRLRYPISVSSVVLPVRYEVITRVKYQSRQHEEQTSPVHLRRYFVAHEKYEETAHRQQCQHCSVYVQNVLQVLVGN